jgi:hypothetical protein
MASTPEQIAAARRKARELALDDVDGPDLSVLAPEKLQEGDELGQPEGEGMAPDELSEPVRRPIAESMQTPLVEADAPEEERLSDLLAGYDAPPRRTMRRSRLRKLDATGNFVSAELLGGTPMPSSIDEPSAREEFLDRGKLVRDWIASKQNAKYKDAMANRMNAPRVVSPPKPPPLPKDPVDVDLDRQRKQAAIDQIKANIAAKRAPKKTGGGKTLPVNALNDLADVDVANQQLDELGNSFAEHEQGGALGKLKAKMTEALGLQGTEAANYDADVRRVNQAVGKILEGGKLAAGDEVKYRAMQPRPGDSPEVVKTKIQGLHDFLNGLKAGRVKLYKAGGYAVPETVDHVAPPKTLDETAQPSPVKMVSPDGKQTGFVLPNKVAAAQKKGWKIVDEAR